MAGRHENTFEDFAMRMRHWHWLARVMKAAGAPSAAWLDQRRSRHPLTRRLVPARRFHDIQLDGYDPRGITATETVSLLDHVRRFRGYEVAWDEYHHPLWDHLMAFFPAKFDVGLWLERVSPNLGLVVLNREAVRRAEELGLPLPSLQKEWGAAYLARLGGASFASLDGLLFLTLILRDHMARDTEDDPRTWLRAELHYASLAFANDLGFEGETLDTWRVLEHTRLIRWQPEARPASEFLADAEAMVGTAPDSQLAPGGRAARRKRRQTGAMALAMQVSATLSDGAASASPFHGFSFLRRNEETVRAAAWLKAHPLATSGALFKHPTPPPGIGMQPHPPGPQEAVRFSVRTLSVNDQIEEFRRVFQMELADASDSQ